MIFFVGGAVYYNNFITRQKIDKAKTDIDSMVNLAANYAKSKQPPSGYAGEVIYVRLQRNVNGNVVADVNGTATTYFSNKVTEDGLTITFNPSILYFWGGSGQLSNDASGSFYGSNQTASINFSITQGVADTRVTVIDSLGNIK